MGYTNCTLSRGKLHQHGIHREALDAALQGHGSYCGQTQISISNIVSRVEISTKKTFLQILVPSKMVPSALQARRVTQWSDINVAASPD
ncbi:hypothetical protein LB503_009297 [Fusarium chuoi]|nr:hypothetical protein LB503_009297 [Fusarium chuoi]